MNRCSLSLSVLLLAASQARAGQMYGTLRDAGGKVLTGVEITIVSPAKTPYMAKTGADGTYQVFVKETGKCELRANVGGKAPATASVFSYDEPAKYDFEVAGGALKAK